MAFPTARDALYGNPPAADHRPDKAVFRDYLESLETMLGAGTIKGFADAVAGLPGSGNTVGDLRIVLADPVADGGVYQWGGTEWDLVAALPSVFWDDAYAREAQAWAEGTLPGGAGTKSALEHAADAGAFALLTAADADATAADREQTTLDRVASGASAAAASVSAGLSSAAAIAAGAPIVTTLTTPIPADGAKVLLQTAAGLRLYQVETGSWVGKGWVGEVLFNDASEVRAYADGGLAVGQRLGTRDRGYAYAVVTSGEHFSNGGGDKIRVIADADGVLPAGAACLTSAPDNSAALAALYADAVAIRYDDFYPVTGNFPRTLIPHFGLGGVTIGGTDIPLNTERTLAEVQVYVGSGSDSANHGLSEDYPFATPQRAIDSLPRFIDHQQIINLVDATYNTSSRAAESMVRPAVLNIDGKRTAIRTAQSGSDLVGAIVFRGESEAGTIIQSNPDAGYAYGVYGVMAHVGFQNLTIEKHPAGTTLVLMTANREAYFHLRGITVDATGVALGAVAEAGGRIESIDSDHAGASGYDIVAYAGSLVQVANPAGDGRTVGKALASSGTVDIAVSSSLTGNSLVTAGGMLTLTGTLSDRVAVSGDITSDPGCFVGGAYADLTGNVVARGTDMRLSVCGWSKTIAMYGGVIRLDGASSFVSPATQSTVAEPLLLRNGAELVVDATTQIRDSAGNLAAQDYGRQQIAVPSNGYTMPITLQGRMTLVNLYGLGANRTGAIINTAAGVLAGTPPPDGAMLKFVCQNRNTFSVEIVESTNAVIPGGAIIVGGFSGNYSACEFVYSELIDKWILSGVGVQF